MHELEDDDQELGEYHPLFQFDPSSAGHATSFPVIENVRIVCTCCSVTCRRFVMVMKLLL